MANPGGLGLHSFFSDISTQMPTHLCESAWLEHGPFALWLGEYLKPKKFVELGTHNGFSYFTFCESFKLINSPHEAFAIDTWQGDEHSGFYDDDVFSSVSQINSMFFSSFSTLVRSTFQDAVEYFEDDSIDLLHIDGLHTYEAVSSDFDLWFSKLSKGSIVLFHDINVRERGFGVHKLWTELSTKYPNFSFSHGHGLGVLKVGSNESSIDWMFDLNQQEISAFRSYFAAMGARVRLQRERNTLTHEVYKKNLEIDQLKISISRLEVEFISERELLINANTKINSLNDLLTIANSNIGALKTSKSWLITKPLRAMGRLFN
jgi:hypothetical protein